MVAVLDIFLEGVENDDGDRKCVKTFSVVRRLDCILANWALHFLLLFEKSPYHPTSHICRSIRARTIQSQQVLMPNFARVLPWRA